MATYIRSAPLFYQLDWKPASTGDTSEQITLVDDEAKHALMARRLRAGDAIEVSNGRGVLGSGVVEATSPKPPELTLKIKNIRVESQPEIELALAAALPKGERQGTLLDMATQLGMRRFIPLECELSSVQFQLKMQARWQRIMLSACKQSRRAYLPEIDQDSSLDNLLESIDSQTAVLYGDQYAEAITAQPESIMHGVKHIICAVGPEGGFTRIESGLLRDHPQAIAVSAGPHILRTETAAIALLTLANQLIK